VPTNTGKTKKHTKRKRAPDSQGGWIGNVRLRDRRRKEKRTKWSARKKRADRRLEKNRDPRECKAKKKIQERGGMQPETYIPRRYQRSKNALKKNLLGESLKKKKKITSRPGKLNWRKGDGKNEQNSWDSTKKGAVQNCRKKIAGAKKRAPFITAGGEAWEKKQESEKESNLRVFRGSSLRGKTDEKRNVIRRKKPKAEGKVARGSRGRRRKIAKKTKKKKSRSK